MLVNILNLFLQRREDEGDVEEDAGEAGEALSPEFKGLGDRLNAKIAQEKAEFSSKMSNFSCVLQELKVVDKVLNNCHLIGLTFFPKPIYHVSYMELFSWRI